MDKKEKNKNDYKIVISELGVDPFHVVNIIFALMCVIPLLAVCYIVIGKRFLYDIFLGVDGAQMAIAIALAVAGLLYAYNLVRNLMEKLLIYAEDRRRADNEKEEFMLSVSRDLRTPLEVIKFEMGNIRAGVDSAVGGIIGETVNRCLSATNKLAELIKNIMDFPSTGFVRTNMRRKFIDLKDIVNAELGNAEIFAKNNRLSLRPRFVTENANLWGDEKKLSKMAANLIHNAMKSTPQGGIVNVLVSSDDDTVRLVVGDGDPELSAKNTNTVFKKSEGPGENSGAEDIAAGEILIARDIVDLHNGHLTVNNRSDKKPEFTIVLPRDLRARSGVVSPMRDTRDRRTVIDDENMNMWIALNNVLTEIVSKTKIKK